MAASLHLDYLKDPYEELIGTKTSLNHDYLRLRQDYTELEQRLEDLTTQYNFMLNMLKTHYPELLL